MRSSVRRLLLIGTHTLAVGVGFGLGIYTLPILIAPESPNIEAVRSTADAAQFKGTFRRHLADSDALHWGEGNLFITPDNIAFEGRLAPGPDYRLYLSPKFIETEAEFESLKPDMVQVGLVQTFENSMLQSCGANLSDSSSLLLPISRLCCVVGLQSSVTAPGHFPP